MHVLPSCPYRDSGLFVIDVVLTAVGGHTGSHCTKKLVTLHQNRWIDKYPPMNYSRHCLAVVSASDGGAFMNVIAMGGEADGGRMN